MAATSFTLGAHWEAFVKGQVESGRYATASEVIRAGLRELEMRVQAEEERREAEFDVDDSLIERALARMAELETAEEREERLAKLRAHLQEGEDEIRRGEVVEFDLDDFLRRANQRAQDYAELERNDRRLMAMVAQIREEDAARARLTTAVQR